jgi:glycosyltransferase involved in cell wall biosynthesis
MGMKDQGWDIMALFGREMQKQGLDPNGRIIMSANTPNPPNVEVDLLNTIYNAADVGVNTTNGGGWELVNFEHAACRVAQVVPNHTSTKEIFEGYGKLIRCDHIDVDTSYGREMPCPSDDHLVELLTELYEDRELLQETADKCYERVIDQCFQWTTIAAEFHKVFQEAMEGVHDQPEPKTVSPFSLDKTGKRKKKSRSKAKETVSA